MELREPMSTLSINFENLNKMYAAMNEVGDDSWHIYQYFGDTVCDASGFGSEACALNIIGQQLGTVDGWFNDMRTVFQTQWRDLQEAIAFSAHEVDRADGDVSEVLTYYRGGYGPTGNPPSPPDGYIENYHLEDIEGLLVAPEEGDAQLNHNNKFDAAADAWDTGRDVINWFIDAVNSMGAGITPLPDYGLRDAFVYPLSGNYGEIRTNANACGNVRDAMSAWGGNFSQLAMKTPQAIEGEASLGLIAQLGAYDLVMKGVGQGIAAGSIVFDSIAMMAEKIAIEVEDVLVILGEKIGKLATKIGSRFVPFAGWALLAWDILTKGWEFVQDIIDDINTVREIITQCQDLVDEVTNWAEVQADRLEKFHDILDTINGLPGVSEGVPGLSGVSDRIGDLEQTLEEVVGFGEDTSEELGDLEGALDDLGSIGEDDDSSSSSYEPDDDEMLMAPGPLDGTYNSGGSTGMTA